MQIAVTLPVTSASAERVHSKVKLIKTFIRSTSADDRSADLIQIYVEHRKCSELVTNELLTVFATRPRKLSVNSELVVKLRWLFGVVIITLT